MTGSNKYTLVFQKCKEFCHAGSISDASRIGACMADKKKTGSFILARPYNAKYDEFDYSEVERVGSAKFKEKLRRHRERHVSLDFCAGCSCMDSAGWCEKSIASVKGVTLADLVRIGCPKAKVNVKTFY